MWKRRTAELEYDWDVADFEEEVICSWFLTTVVSPYC
jgi:hypothetical protein